LVVPAISIFVGFGGAVELVQTAPRENEEKFEYTVSFRMNNASPLKVAEPCAHPVPRDAAVDIPGRLTVSGPVGPSSA
jgi:hypothetical protein